MGRKVTVAGVYGVIGRAAAKPMHNIGSVPCGMK
jgi:hypothetical protein